MSEQVINLEEYKKEVDALAEAIEDLLVSDENKSIRVGAIDALNIVLASMLQLQINQGREPLETAKIRAEKTIGWLAARVSNQFLETYGETLFGLQPQETHNTDEKES